jgi:hypothetical protein
VKLIGKPTKITPIIMASMARPRISFPVIPGSSRAW